MGVRGARRSYGQLRDRGALRPAGALPRRGAAREATGGGLLHGRGKRAATRLWHGVGGVLLARFARRVRARLARGGATFARSLDDARRGAELARADGASDRVVGLIARHHDIPVDDDERLLARADREALP